MKKLIFILALIAVSLTGAGYLVSNRTTTPLPDEGYTTLPVEFGDLSESISSTGPIQPQDVVVVGCELSGRVKRLLADFNQEVKENDVLLELDDRKAQADVKEAEAAVCTAKASIMQAESVRNGARIARDKLKTLLSEDIGRQSDIDKAQMDLEAAEALIKVAQCRAEQAQAALQKAQLGLDLTIVRSPCRGTIIDKKVTLNQLIAPPASGQLFTLAKDDLGTLHIHAQVAEGDISKIKIGQDVSFQVYAFDSDRRFTGTVVQLRPMPTSVQGAVYYDVVIKVANVRDPERTTGSAPHWQLLPGMTATIDIIRRKHSNVWKMPAAAVNFQLPEPLLTEAARAKLTLWHDRADAADWKNAWTLDPTTHKPLPLFFRTGGTRVKPKGSTAKAPSDESGIQDAQSLEVLEWEPDFAARFEPNAVESVPRVIITAPAPPKSGILNPPKIKLS